MKRKAEETYTSPGTTPTERPRTSYDYPSSSTQVANTPSTSQQKGKGRKKAEPQEKRLARFRASCPNDISVRLDRYLSQAQRIYLIERTREGEALREEFAVQGSTGNVYTVTIDNVPHCDCPDHQKGHHCKHLLFILLKVLQVPQISHYWYQKALLTSELSEIFTNAPPPPQLRGSFIANERVVGAWRKATGRESTSTDATSSAAPSDDPRRVPASEDDCPICYDKMNGNGLDLKGLDELLEWCDECHNAVHKECWTQWRTTKQKQGQALTCVYCRSNWRDFTGTVESTVGIVGASDEGFVNLASVSGVSTERDTSTYYQSPRRSYSGYSSRSRYGYGYGYRY
ncbi:hypothetical protein GYMLUDRAFT_233301 [Collybiopsis luxurians FD-317 M1]|uniref:SWIM-type domain-containing protein n=1 Tax=Collybiopsis luxurians FD-317 M1 TaxID=944289 RepID=A0A0D0BDT4_9AGAR|nr:hypothetical protein GYMLUDRAFT_233301 [Collybiopsis luxurians FD-317 M1]